MSIIANALTYFGANIFASLIPFFMLPILTRVLTPSEYGIIGIFEALMVGFGVFAGLNIHGAISVRFFRGDRKTFPQYIGVSLMLLLVNTVCLSLLILACGSPLAVITGFPTYVLIISLVSAAAQLIYNIRLTIWQVEKNPVRYGVFQIGQTGLNAVFSLFFVLVLSLGAVGRMAGISLAIISYCLFALISLVRSRSISLKWNYADLKDLLNFGIPLIPHAIGGVLALYADRFIINRQLGSDATGMYFVAMQMSMPLLLIGSSMNRAFVPWLYDKLDSRKNLLAVTVSYMWIILTVIAGLIYCLIIYWGLPYIVGDKFIEVRTTAIILSIGTTFQATYYAVVNYLFYARLTGVLSMITFVTSGIQMIVMFEVAGEMGLSGVASVFTLVQAFVFILVWVASAWLYPQPWRDFRGIMNVVRDFLSNYPAYFAPRIREAK